EYSSNRVIIDVPEGGAGYLVLTDIWFPGWQCRVDDAPMRVYRANFLFRAIRLWEGSHEVIFTFDPVSYRLGKNITGGMLMFILILHVWKLGYSLLLRFAAAPRV